MSYFNSLMSYFNSKSKYLIELRQRSQFRIPFVHSVFSGTDSLKISWAIVMGTGT